MSRPSISEQIDARDAMVAPTEAMSVVPAPAVARSGIPRGWNETIISAVRLDEENSPNPQLLVAGLNVGVFPDFCAARMIGCLNIFHVDTSRLTEGERKYASALPHWKAHVPELGSWTYRNEDVTKYLAPVIGVFHYLCSAYSEFKRARTFIGGDRVGGLTIAGMSKAMEHIAGRHLYNNRSASVEVSDTYLNYNSMNNVKHFSIDVRSIRGNASILDKKFQPLLANIVDKYGNDTSSSWDVNTTFLSTVAVPFWPQ